VCCSVLQCGAVCCSVLQCVAVCCSVLQCVAACCSESVDCMRFTTTHCNECVMPHTLTSRPICDESCHKHQHVFHAACHTYLTDYVTRIDASCHIHQRACQFARRYATHMNVSRMTCHLLPTRRQMRDQSCHVHELVFDEA